MTELAPTPRGRLEQLTPMEQACLRLVARHLSSKEIALELGIAKTSVDTYCNRARAKLAVADRYEAARMLTGGCAPEPVAAVVAPAVARRGRGFAAWPQVRLVAMLGAAFVLVLALATLLAGLRALEDMKPLPAPGSAGARGATA